jgi:hypothetical protein
MCIISQLHRYMTLPAYRSILAASEENYCDWLKVMRLIQRQHFFYESPGERYSKHISECSEAWTKLGKFFQFVGSNQQAKRWVPCSYPRCPEATLYGIGARISCSGCNVAHYCGVYCQKACVVLAARGNYSLF